MSAKRRKTRQVKIGRVKIGGGAPVSVQSMTKTDTLDIRATLSEIKRLEKAGCEIVRVAVKNEDCARAFGEIKKRTGIPLVADIHFNYKLALTAIQGGADAIRLNPGNLRNRTQIKEILNLAKRKRIPIRIGVNSGSLRTPERMVNEVLKYIKIFEDENFRNIILSLKSSEVSDAVRANRMIAARCGYPIHLGITASGLPKDGIIKSSIGIGSLLLDGIGDTIRVSLTDDPVKEVEASKSILQSLGLRRFGPQIISCPTCGRCGVDLRSIVNKLDTKLSAIRYPLSAKPVSTVAVMGCEVNGPGEAREADIGIAAGKKSGVLFRKGKIMKKINEKDFVKEIMKEAKL